ncbi:MAG: tetratricopeptide repeat protein, partial [Thermoplasmata archaeon]
VNELQMSKTTFYSFFRTKEELFLECTKYIFNQMFNEVWDSIRKEKEVIPRLLKRTDAFLDAYPKWRDMMYLLRGNAISSNREFSMIYKESLIYVIQPIIRDIERAVEQGKMRKDINPEITGFAFMGVAEYLAELLYMFRKYDKQAILEQVEKMESKPDPALSQTVERMPLLSMDITREHMPDAQELEKAVNDIIHKFKVPKRVGEKTAIILDPSKKQLLYGTLTNIELHERRLGKILNARAWQMLGNALYCIGDYEKAVKCYDKALAEDKGFRHAWEGKGYALRHLGDESGANHCFGTLRMLRSAFNGWLEKGNMHMRKGEFELAIECYKKACELDPDDEKPLFNLGLALKRLGRYEEAVQTYDKALAISEDPETWNNKGNALAKLGRYEDAVESFKNALRLKPDYETARVNMNICASRILKH